MSNNNSEHTLDNLMNKGKENKIDVNDNYDYFESHNNNTNNNIIKHTLEIKNTNNNILYEKEEIINSEDCINDNKYCDIELNNRQFLSNKAHYIKGENTADMKLNNYIYNRYIDKFLFTQTEVIPTYRIPENSFKSDVDSSSQFRISSVERSNGGNININTNNEDKKSEPIKLNSESDEKSLYQGISSIKEDTNNDINNDIVNILQNDKEKEINGKEYNESDVGSYHYENKTI